MYALGEYFVATIGAASAAEIQKPSANFKTFQYAGYFKYLEILPEALLKPVRS